MEGRIPRKLKKVIPSGHYCYVPDKKRNKNRGENQGHYYIKSCKFFKWIKVKDRPASFHEEGDEEFAEERIQWCARVQYEIDDQCKSCGDHYGSDKNLAGRWARRMKRLRMKSK